jgi:hypothetical protein
MSFRPFLAVAKHQEVRILDSSRLHLTDNPSQEPVIPLSSTDNISLAWDDTSLHTLRMCTRAGAGVLSLFFVVVSWLISSSCNSLFLSSSDSRRHDVLFFYFTSSPSLCHSLMKKIASLHARSLPLSRRLEQGASRGGLFFARRHDFVEKPSTFDHSAAASGSHNCLTVLQRFRPFTNHPDVLIHCHPQPPRCQRAGAMFACSSSRAYSFFPACSASRCLLPLRINQSKRLEWTEIYPA